MNLGWTWGGSEVDLDGSGMDLAASGESGAIRDGGDTGMKGDLGGSGWI